MLLRCYTLSPKETLFLQKKEGEIHWTGFENAHLEAHRRLVDQSDLARDNSL